MRKSYKPVSCGFYVRMMSPLGLYPDKDIILDDACLIATPEICFSIIRIKEEDWGFSEVDSLTPQEIPLLGSLLLPRVGSPYPVHGVTLEANHHKYIGPECIQECRTHLLLDLEEQKEHEWPSAVIHRPPILGGNAYDLADYSDRIPRIRECLLHLESAGPIVKRGVASLLKAQMAWRHGEFADAACIFLWIALDAAHSLTLQKLREGGINNPTSKDASDYFNKIIGFETPWEKFFEEDYENRIRAIHPDNRFCAESRPQFLADDFLELNDLLIPYFMFLVSGTFLNRGGIP